MKQKRVVLFVEGEGEAKAAPILVRRIVTEKNGHDAVFVDSETFRVGHLRKLAKNGYENWQRQLQAAAKRSTFGGVLLLLDGDAPPMAGQQFCAATAAYHLAERSQAVGAGTQFSVACVFACQEFESWFIAAADSFDELPEGRKILLSDDLPPDPEIAPRDAKKWMDRAVSTGYKPTQDQAVFAKEVNLQRLREKNVRSFARLEHAVDELIHASRSGNHFVSPSE